MQKLATFRSAYIIKLRLPTFRFKSVAQCSTSFGAWQQTNLSPAIHGCTANTNRSSLRVAKIIHNKNVIRFFELNLVLFVLPEVFGTLAVLFPRFPFFPPLLILVKIVSFLKIVFLSKIIIFLLFNFLNTTFI